MVTDPRSNFLILISNILQGANDLKDAENILRKFLDLFQDEYNCEYCSLLIASNSSPSKEIRLSTRIVEQKNGVKENKKNAPIFVIQSSIKNDFYCILEIQSSDGKSYTNEEVFGFQVLVNQITVFVENVYLHEALSRRDKNGQKILEINQKLRSTTNMQELLQLSVEELQRALGVSQVQVILKRSEDNDHPGI